MKISLIAAVAENRGIGKGNQLLWHLPNDLKFFKAYTMGKVMLMGRKTFESIGKRVLPGRISAVISRNSFEPQENLLFFADFNAALKHFGDVDELCIVGGAQIYQEALPVADRLVLTHVKAAPEADVFFPEVDWSEWEKESEERHSRMKNTRLTIPSASITER